jgi:hypothetical protein
MSRALDIAKAHFGRQETRIIKVPEWDDMDIHVRPMTLGDQEELFKIQSKHGDKSLYLFAAVMVRKALGADLKPLFVAKDIDELMDSSDGSVLKRVAGEMMATSGVEEIKNS